MNSMLFVHSPYSNPMYFEFDSTLNAVLISKESCTNMSIKGIFSSSDQCRLEEMMMVMNFVEMFK